MDQIRIGKFIAKLRNEKNMTQQELAYKIGVTDRAISKWENGRGLPDISLIQPLCKELDITINELLSGEKIKKEEYQKKSEDNIINTLDYSKKRIKRIKIITIFIITLIILILFTFFIIDVKRMKDNKPVIFSTWGFKYVPPINIEENKIYLKIKEYIVEKGDNEIKYHDNEKTFTSMRVYLLEEKETYYYVYAWVMEASYYLENNVILKDSASSIPYKFKVEKINNEYKVVDSRIPRDGTFYQEDMKNIFPKSVRDDMEKCQIDGTIEKLEIEVEEQAKLYFHK